MGFANAVIGGASALIRQAIKSPNYAAGVTGWSVNKDGSAEFNSITFRGTLAGTNFIINSSGAFFYSPSEGAGNLVNSITPAGATGTDGFGNHYVGGQASYAAGFCSAMTNGIIQFYTGSLAAGWTTAAAIESDGSFIDLASTSTIQISAPAIEIGTGGQTVQINGDSNTGTSGLTDGTINGNSQQVGLPNGGIQGTSGGASTGTAHTHGPGSYSVTNGQHTHGPGSYAVTNGTHDHLL
jgi:hypothetical protein